MVNLRFRLLHSERYNDLGLYSCLLRAGGPRITLRRTLLAMLLMLALCCISHADQAASAVGWKNINGQRYIPLDALAKYVSGNMNVSTDGQIRCKLGSNIIKLKIDSPTITIGTRSDQLSSKTIRIDGEAYVIADFPAKVGWDSRITPLGVLISNSTSENELIVSSERSVIRKRRSSTGTGKVGIWYNPAWHSDDAFLHWREVETRKGEMPSSGAYSAGDPKVIDRQFRELSECGFDFIVMDARPGVFADDKRIDGNMKAWFGYMDKKPPFQRIPIAIAAGGELIVPDSGIARTLWTQSVDHLWKTYAAFPSYLRDNGKPVLHWAIMGKAWQGWNDDRWIIRRTYDLFHMDEMIQNGGWGYGCYRRLGLGAGCASFNPGWSRALPGLTRDNAARYQRFWIETLKRYPEYVLIASWNGWNEGDAIEDSASWTEAYHDHLPSSYRILTQGYVAVYRGELIDGFYYRDEEKPEVYRWTGGKLRWQFPENMPVVVLPSGMLTELSGAELPGPG